jgi:hypothetical protein
MKEEEATEGGGKSATVTVSEVVDPEASVTDATYVPAGRLYTVNVVSPVFHKQE